MDKQAIIKLPKIIPFSNQHYKTINAMSPRNEMTPKISNFKIDSFQSSLLKTKHKTSPLSKTRRKSVPNPLMILLDEDQIEGQRSSRLNIYDIEREAPKPDIDNYNKKSMNQKPISNRFNKNVHNLKEALTPSSIKANRHEDWSMIQKFDKNINLPWSSAITSDKKAKRDQTIGTSDHHNEIATKIQPKSPRGIPSINSSNEKPAIDQEGKTQVNDPKKRPKKDDDDHIFKQDRSNISVISPKKLDMKLGFDSLTCLGGANDAVHISIVTKTSSPMNLNTQSYPKSLIDETRSQKQGYITERSPTDISTNFNDQFGIYTEDISSVKTTKKVKFDKLFLTEENSKFDGFQKLLGMCNQRELEKAEIKNHQNKKNNINSPPKYNIGIIPIKSNANRINSSLPPIISKDNSEDQPFKGSQIKHRFNLKEIRGYLQNINMDIPKIKLGKNHENDVNSRKINPNINGYNDENNKKNTFDMQMRSDASELDDIFLKRFKTTPEITKIIAKQYNKEENKKNMMIQNKKINNETFQKNEINMLMQENEKMKNLKNMAKYIEQEANIHNEKIISLIDRLTNQFNAFNS